MSATKASTLFLLTACLASAQFGWLKGTWKKKDPHETGTVGMVIKKDPDSFVLRADDTRIVTFKIDADTRYFHGDRWSNPSQLKRSTVVSVEAAADRYGILTATEITLQDSNLVFKPRAKAKALLIGGTTGDELIDRARESSQSFFRVLPNFLCQQSTTRAYAGHDKKWRTIDQVTAEVVYARGHESYRDVKLNGRATGGSIMDLPGSRSTGEFASTLRALFDKDTAALFKFESNATLSGFYTGIYNFAVSGDDSDWRITAGSQMIMTAYTGKIWIDRKSGNVVRIEMKAVDIPRRFPFQRVEAEVDYGPVPLSTGSYFLPARAENISCNHPQSCSRNVIEFRNYHKYVGESSITFQEPVTPPSDR